MRAPVARNSRPSAQDRNLPCTSTSIPGPKRLLKKVAGQRLLIPVQPSTRPAGSRSRTPPRQPPDLRERSVPGLVGRAAEVLVVDLAVRNVQGQPVDRDDPQPAAGHPGCPLVPDQPRDLLEQEPDRRRAELAAAPRQRGDVRRLPSPPLPASTQPPGSSCCPASRPAARRWWYSPSASLVITCPYPQFRPRNSHNASTKYITSRAGSSGRRCSRAPASATAASTSSGVKTLASTPTEIRSGSQPSGESPSEPSCATKS